MKPFCYLVQTTSAKNPPHGWAVHFQSGDVPLYLGEQTQAHRISEDAYRKLMRHAHRLAMDGHGELAQHLRDAIYGRGPWESGNETA
jgi:hypothetical protein